MSSPIEGWIEAALEGSGWTFAEIMEGVQRGDFHPFVHEEGCMVGEFITSPRATGFNIFAAGGSLKAMHDLIPLAEAYARSRGATFAGCVGRKGWVRFLQPYGYAPEISVQKEL